MRSFGRVFRCSKKITTNNERPKRMNILECQRTQPAMCVSFCHQLGNFNYFPNKLQEWLFWCCNHWIYIYSTRITSPEKKTTRAHAYLSAYFYVYTFISLLFCRTFGAYNFHTPCNWWLKWRNMHNYIFAHVFAMNWD